MFIYRQSIFNIDISNRATHIWCVASKWSGSAAFLQSISLPPATALWQLASVSYKSYGVEKALLLLPKYWPCPTFGKKLIGPVFVSSGRTSFCCSVGTLCLILCHMPWASWPSWPSYMSYIACTASWICGVSVVAMTKDEDKMILSTLESDKY